MRGEDLEADGKVFPAVEVRRAAGDGNAGDAGEVGGEGENVGEVFVERIVGKTADLPRRAGGDRREDGVHLLERVLEIAANERADFLGAAVIGVVVTGREDVSAEDDPALHFGAEAFLAGFFIKIENVGRVGGAMAVADAVEAGKVRRGFRRGDDVVGGDGVLGVGQGNLDDFRALGGEFLDGGLDVFADAGVDAFAKVFLGNAEFEAFHAVVEAGEVIGDRGVEAGRVERIAAGDGLEDERGVLNALREWGQSTRIDIFLALLMFRIQFSAWPANLDFSMPVRYIT